MQSLENTYISIKFVRNSSLTSLKKQLCHKYSLAPRSEIHLTLTFLGAMNYQMLEELKSKYTINKVSFDYIEINGIGGAFLKNGVWIEMDDKNVLESYIYPRVMWFSIKNSSELIALQNHLSALDKNSYSSSDYYPHITIGSGNGKFDEIDLTTFDVYDFKKKPSLENLNFKIYPKVIHLTDTSIHPKSLAELYTF